MFFNVKKIDLFNRTTVLQDVSVILAGSLENKYLESILTTFKVWKILWAAVTIKKIGSSLESNHQITS